MIKTNRREFLKIGALGLGGIIATQGMNYAGSPEFFSRNGIKRLPTYCEVCFWKCAGWVHYDKKGEPYKVVGNENDPLCNGRLCPRGSAGLGMYNDPDRLRTPLIRDVKDGVQYWKEASWPQAIDFIAARMRKIMDEHGPESLALFNHGSGGKHFTRLFKALGSGNIAAPSYAQCRGPREVAFETTFGTAVNSPEPLDIRNTQCLVLIGSHLGENMHNSQVQEMSELIDRGATIITVDPRLSTAAAHSDFWLPIKPATDIALMLAWMHEIIENGLYDKQFVESQTFGFEDLAIHVSDKTPEWAAKITGLDPGQIRKTAWAMAEASPSVIIHPGRHVTWYGDDTQRIRCVAILNALLGSWGRKGGFFNPSTAKLPTFPHPPYPKPEWTWRDIAEGNYALAGSAISNVIIDASHPDNTSDKKIKGWFVVGTNLPQTVPDQQRTFEALQNLDLVVVVDTMPVEMTGYADVVLPECTYLERYDDLRNSPYRYGTLAVRMPAAKPKYLSRPSDWMVRKLGEKFGLHAHFDYDDYGDVVNYQLSKLGSSLDDIRKKGVLSFNQERNDLYTDYSEPQEYKTATGKIELYSFALEDEGFDPLPEYTPHPEPPEGYFRLNYGRAPMHTFSRTANNSMLADLMEENNVWVNPVIASTLHLKNNDEVYLRNQDGVVSEFKVKVRVTERIGPDSVYIVHGFGHNNRKLKRSFGKGVSDTQLITNVMKDPVMGGTGMRGNFVQLLKDKPEEEALI